MRYLRQFALIIAVSLVGELISLIIPLPVPASVYGLVLMLVLLLTGVVKLSAVRDVAAKLVEFLPLLFIPASVEMIELWPLPGRLWVAAACSVVVVTLVMMAVTGHTAQLVRRLQHRAPTTEQPVGDDPVAPTGEAA